MTIGERIKRRRKELGLSVDEVAKILKKNRATIYRYESNEIENLPTTALGPLANALHTTPAELMGWEEDSAPSSSPSSPAPNIPGAFPVPGGHRIPVLGRVVAGIPIEAVEDIIGYIEIDEKMAKNGTYYGLQVKGGSMEPTLHEGDVIVVRKQERIESGEIAIVLVNGDEATVKEVKESESGLTLIGHNVAVYSPHFYSWQEVESLPIQVIGKVVELRRRL